MSVRLHEGIDKYNIRVYKSDSFQEEAVSQPGCSGRTIVAEQA